MKIFNEELIFEVLYIIKYWKIKKNKQGKGEGIGSFILV